METNDEVVFDVSIEDKLPALSTAIFGFQHLLALTGIWIFPILIGQALNLKPLEVSHIVQACFLTTGLVTILQSSRVLRLPVVQGPTAAFFVAVLAGGATYGLGATYGSMLIAGLVSMLFTIPIRGLGLFGHLLKYVGTPLVYGTLLIIIGASLAGIGLEGWFGVPGTSSFGMPSLLIACFSVVVVLLCMIFGGHTIIHRGAVLWGVIAGTLLAYATGNWTVPNLSETSYVSLPTAFPFGFSISPPLVLLFLLAYLQAGAEAMGIYTLLGSWSKQTITRDRVHRGLFSEFMGCAFGAAFGGLGTTSYPENVGIIRITKIASRYVTLTAGAFGVALSLFPRLSLLIAGLPSPVLAGVSTLIFGIFSVSGIQMLSKVEWDELNIAVAAPAFIVSLGLTAIPHEILARLPVSLVGFLKPMMMATVMLIFFNIVINHVVRPRMRCKEDAAEVTTQA